MVYVLLDATKEYYFGHELAIDMPTKDSIIFLLKKAKQQVGVWPKQILISKKDPFINVLSEICIDLQLPLIKVTPAELQPYIKNFKYSFTKFHYGIAESAAFSEEEQEELRAFIPDTYDPCWCGSDKKFKFCCQKGLHEITFAMCAAESGDVNKAISHMQAAELKVGRTAEIMCRYAICWSFVDRKKYNTYLNEAIKVNPNHPRSNYLLGIDAVSKGDYQAAIEYYNKALMYYPKQDKFHLNETYNNLGSAFFQIRQYSEAKEVWEKALMLLPSDKMVIKNLVELIYKNDSLPEHIRKISPFMNKYLSRYVTTGSGTNFFRIL